MFRFDDEVIVAALKFMEMAPKSNNVDEMKKFIVNDLKYLNVTHDKTTCRARSNFFSC